MSWTQQQYTDWTWSFALIGGAMAFIWLGTGYWLFGLFSILCMIFAGWSWIESERTEPRKKKDKKDA